MIQVRLGNFSRGEVRTRRGENEVKGKKKRRKGGKEGEREEKRDNK